MVPVQRAEKGCRRSQGRFCPRGRGGERPHQAIQGQEQAVDQGHNRQAAETGWRDQVASHGQKQGQKEQDLDHQEASVSRDEAEGVTGCRGHQVLVKTDCSRSDSRHHGFGPGYDLQAPQRKQASQAQGDRAESQNQAPFQDHAQGPEAQEGRCPQEEHSRNVHRHRGQGPGRQNHQQEDQGLHEAVQDGAGPAGFSVQTENGHRREGIRGRGISTCYHPR